MNPYPDGYIDSQVQHGIIKIDHSMPPHLI